MKNSKKIISIILAAVMMMSFISLPSFAAAGSKLTLKDGASAIISAGYIYGLNAEGTKLSDIKAQLGNESDKIVAVDKDNAAVADDSYLGTGSIIRLVDATDTIDELTVIIFGDVNGDGAIDAFDIFTVDKAINSLTALSGSYALAADVDEDGATDIDDYDAIMTDLSGFEPVDQNGSIELPEAEIEQVTPETVFGIIPDAEFEFESTQTDAEIEGRRYADWDVDFVLSFNQEVNKNQIYLLGQYGTYGWIGDKIAESGTLAADEEFSIVHTWLAGVLEKSSFALTYSDIVKFVRDFKCAIYAPYAQPGLTATLKLVMTDNVTGETHVRSVITHTFEKYIPNAEITPVAADAVGDSNDGTLVGRYSSDEVSADVALNYSSSEALADVEGKQCLNYAVDFEITFNKPVEAEKVYLFGQYDNPYGLGWVGDKLSVVPAYEDATIPANTKISLISDLIGPAMGRTLVITYSDILNEVGDMKTALHVENPEDGLKVTVTLVMTDTFTGERYVVSSYEYSYYMPELPSEPNISPPSMTNKVTSGGKTYYTDLYIKYTTKDTAASIADKEYKDWNVDLLISFNHDLDGNDVHLFGKNGANSWADGTLSNTIAAGKKTALLNDFLGGTLTYSELVASGTNGLRFAVDVTDPPSGLILTVQFVITNPSNGKHYVIDTLTFSGF